MRKINDIYDEIIHASKLHDKEAIKEKLLELNIRRESNRIFNVYRDFINNIHQSSAIELLDSLLIKALEKDDTPWAKYLIESEELRVKPNVNSKNIWKCAIDEGNLEVVQCLVNNKRYTSGGGGIVNALGFVNISLSVDIAKYLVDDESMPYHQEVWSKLKDNAKGQAHGFYMVDPHFPLFINACSVGNVSLIDFLLQHEQLKKMVNKSSFEQGILVACVSDSLETVKYLLTSPDIPYRFPNDIHYEWLLNAVNTHNAVDIGKYIVFDLRLPESDYKSKGNNKLLDKMFDIRNVHDKLDSELENKAEEKNSPQKKKI